jgi:4,5-dihydroxyphthalate decarboxylase
MRYDVTMPLVDGRVQIDGVKLVPSRSAPGATIIGPDSPIPTGDFGLIDMNMGNWLPGIEAGWEIAPLPVFSKRKHVYTYLFCRADAGINSPRDLEGKRVMSSIAGSAVAIWLKALLQHRHGVDVDSITWVSARERFPLHKEWRIEAPEGRKSVLEALLDGDVDATAADVSDRKLWHTLETDPRIKRVFPSYLEEAKAFFDETGIFAPVHMIVMSKKLDRQHPDLAGKLYDAFEQAKQIADDDVLDDRSGFAIIDLREQVLRQQQEWGDLFKHGITANKATIDTFAAHCREHGLVKDRYGYEEMFAASTLDT